MPKTTQTTILHPLVAYKPAKHPADYTSCNCPSSAIFFLSSPQDDVAWVYLVTRHTPPTRLHSSPSNFKSSCGAKASLYVTHFTTCATNNMKRRPGMTSSSFEGGRGCTIKAASCRLLISIRARFVLISCMCERRRFWEYLRLLRVSTEWNNNKRPAQPNNACE